jgi:mRNA interferase HigB
VISPKRIQDFVKRYADSGASLQVWFKIARRSNWKSLADLHADFPSADLVGRRTVFNVKGNAYRLIARVNFNRRAIYILHILTHAEYDKGKWKK